MKDLASFQAYALTCSQNCGHTLYGLVWMLVASKTELKLRLAATKTQLTTTSSACAQLQKQLSRCQADLKHVRKINSEFVRKHPEK